MSMRATATSTIALIAEQIAALVPSPQARMLDYGCGEALHADLRRRRSGRAFAVRRRAAGARRRRRAFCRIRKSARVAPDDVKRLPDRSLDLIVLHSVAQYLTPDGVGNAAARCSTGC